MTNLSAIPMPPIPSLDVQPRESNIDLVQTQELRCLSQKYETDEAGEGQSRKRVTNK